MKTFPALLAAALLLLPPGLNAATIGIVRDGPGAEYFDVRTADIKKELADLAEDDYTVAYREFDGGWDEARIREALTRALEDPEVDVVYAAGMVASMMAHTLSDEERRKPVFGGAVQYSNAADYPISEDGTSSIANFAFISNPQRVAADLELLVRLAGTNRIYVLIDGMLLRNLPHANEGAKRFEEELGITIHFATGGDDPASYLDALPEEAKAVYVAILGRLDTGERKTIYDGLRDRDCISVAMGGPDELELGALAVLATDSHKPITRRIALSLHQLIKGALTADLPVYLPVEDRLMLNMLTARAIGWSPNYNLALEALFTGEGALEGGRELDLAGAMRLAVERNVELELARDALAIQQGGERRARSALRPGASLAGEHGWTEIDGKVDPNGPDDVHGGSYGVELTQLLFNDAAWSNRKAAAARTRASVHAVESARLDAMEAAGTAFLNLLLNRALYRIQQENLRLTDNNLRLARLRRSIGAADPSEVYRWESNAAQDRAALFRQDGEVRKALANLNRVLGVPQSRVWTPADIELADDEFYFIDEEMKGMVDSFDQFMAFGDFLEEQAVAAAPELQRFDAALAAQGIVLKQVQRRRFLPEIAGVTSWKVKPQGSNLAPDDEQEEWFIGVNASLPLFEGGGIRARADEEKARLTELEHQRLQAVQFIGQQSRDVWNGMGSLHPSIRLSRRARDAARRNYLAVRDKYSQGSATILDLLDAQVQQLQQEQQTAQALYSYLTVMVQLQRVISWFEHEKSPAERQAWADALQRHLESPDKDLP